MDALFATARKEAQKRRSSDTWVQKAGQLRTLLMPIQVRLEADGSRRIAVRSPRQTGKSTGVMLIVTIRCLERMAAEWVVVGLTRPSVKRIYWTALKKLNEMFDLGIEFQHQELIATFKNGSKIYFVGAENIGEIEKLRGGRYDGVIIDECKSFAPTVFTELVHDVIEPALMAKDGQLFIIGTPGDHLAGPFYLATCEDPVVTEVVNEIGERTGEQRLSNAPYGTTPEHPAMWSLHQWRLEDNVTQFERRDGVKFTLWEQALEIQKRNGWSDTHPTWRREYLGHWVADDLKRVYRYKPHLHDYTPSPFTKYGLPKALEQQGWRTVIGCDFGTRDGTALAVWAYHPHMRGLWELYSEVRRVDKGERLSVTDIATWYKEVEADFGPFDGWPADPGGLATMVIDTLADEHGVFLETAEKKEKLDHIELFNADLDAGLIHIIAGGDLSKELLASRWDEKKMEKGKREEDRNIPNDAADAALYAFRWCNHRRAKDRRFHEPMYSPAWWNEVAEVELAEARAKARKTVENAGALDGEWWLS